MMKVMLVAILISIVVAAVLYAKIYPASGGIDSGVYLRALIGIFAVCTFVIHNYVFLNIGLTLTLYQGITYFIQWVIVGAAIGSSTSHLGQWFRSSPRGFETVAGFSIRY